MLVVSAAMLVVLYTSPVHGRPPGGVWLHRVLETLRSLVVAAEGERIRGSRRVGWAQPWLPQDDRLSYSESLRDSGVSRT